MNENRFLRAVNDAPIWNILRRVYCGEAGNIKWAFAQEDIGVVQYSTSLAPFEGFSGKIQDAYALSTWSKTYLAATEHGQVYLLADLRKASLSTLEVISKCLLPPNFSLVSDRVGEIALRCQDPESGKLGELPLEPPTELYACLEWPGDRLLGTF